MENTSGRVVTPLRTGWPNKPAPRKYQIVIQEITNNPRTTAITLQTSLLSVKFRVHDSMIRKSLVKNWHP